MEQQVMDATQTVVDTAVKKGIFTKDNAIKGLAVVGAVFIAIEAVTAAKGAYKQFQDNKKRKATPVKETVDVEVEKGA